MALPDINYEPTDVDIALIEDIDDLEKAFVIEQAAGNRFFVWNVDTDNGEIYGDSELFESYAEALRHIADQVE